MRHALMTACAVLALLSVSAQAQKLNSLVGLKVYSSDGRLLGPVQCVETDNTGRVTIIALKNGGFLGFGGKLVAIPDGKFTRVGDNVQLGMTSEQVSRLPEKLGDCKK